MEGRAGAEFGDQSNQLVGSRVSSEYPLNGRGWGVGGGDTSRTPTATAVN